MPAASVTGAEGLGQKATSRNMPQTVYETEKRYDYISYYDPVIGHQITSSLTVTVNRGNTLWDIINHQYGNLSGPEMADKIEQIKKINKLTNPNKLSVGQDLVLPDPKFELAERYIDKYRRLNKKINFHSALIERQMVLIREAQPEEMPNNSIKIERYNPEVKTFTVDQTEPRKFYWIAKKEDEETFLKGSKKRREEHKQFLYNLFHGTGVGDITGWASGGASKSSRQLITVRPYLTRGKNLKHYHYKPSKWKYKPSVLTEEQFMSRFIKVKISSASIGYNAFAALVDFIFEGLDTKDWDHALLHAARSFGEGIIVSLSTAAIIAGVVGTGAAPLEAAAGPPGWVILVFSLTLSAGLTQFINWFDDAYTKWLDSIVLK